MKAISRGRSLRKHVHLSDSHLGISRNKAPADDPLSLLYNMNDCYSKLKELVPSLPANKNVSKMEILQHVIDYILDLQIVLDSHSQQQQQQQRSPSAYPVQSAEVHAELHTDDCQLR